MKKILAMLLAVAMLLSLAACSSKTEEAAVETEEASSDIEIAVVLKTLASEYWGYVKEGCDAAAADLGVTVTVVGPGAESDIEGQVAMIEQQIGAGCSAIVCAPNDADAASAALQAAIDKGIPVLSVDTNVGIEGQTSFVGTSNVDAAKEGGVWACGEAGEGAKAVIIYGQEGDNTSNMRRQGYEEACEECGVEVLAALSGQNTTDGATKTMEDLISSYGDEIDLVFCHNDDTAIGAMNACKSAGIEDIIIVGFDGNASCIELINSGCQIKATIAQQPYMMGYQVIEAAVKAINGETVEEVINAPVEVITADASTAAATEEPVGDIEIAVVLKTLASEYWGYVKEGCDAAAADLGIKVTVVGPGAESDIEGQVAMIEQQIGAGCSAIVCAPNDAGAAAAALQAALDQGIPVLSVDTNVGIEGQTSFVGTSNVEAAKQGGVWACGEAGEGAKAVIIYGQEGDNTSNMRREGYEAACEECGVEVLAALSGQNTTDGATKTMEDLISSYGDEIDLVFCHNDDTAIGAMNACKSAGIEDIIIVGFDGNASCIELINSGCQIKATVAQQPYQMGYQVIEAAYKAILGETVEEVINAPVEVVTAG